MASELTNRDTLTKQERDVFEAMKYLDRTKGTPTQKEMARIAGLSPATVHRVIARLEAKGYMGSDKVTRNRSPRSYRITNFKRTRTVRHAE